MRQNLIFLKYSFELLYDSNYNYVKKYSSIIRFLNKLILKGGVKHVLLLLAILFDSDHFFFFFTISNTI